MRIVIGMGLYIIGVLGGMGIGYHIGSKELTELLRGLKDQRSECEMKDLPRNAELAVDLLLNKMDDQFGGMDPEDKQAAIDYLIAMLQDGSRWDEEAEYEGDDE